ncbi:MAG: hypothetical protein II542_07405, partial [Bacteroidales bacterium]|nr:hypothetical protein [Bacteroidales bacterium]
EVEKPDLVFGLFHSGMDGGIKTDTYEENATAAVAREVPGFDIIFFGHDHQVHNEWITNSEGQQVLIIDPSCYVRNVAEAEIELTFENNLLVKKTLVEKYAAVAFFAVRGWTFCMEMVEVQVAKFSGVSTSAESLDKNMWNARNTAQVDMVSTLYHLYSLVGRYVIVVRHKRSNSD